MNSPDARPTPAATMPGPMIGQPSAAGPAGPARRLRAGDGWGSGRRPSASSLSVLRGGDHGHIPRRLAAETSPWPDGPTRRPASPFLLPVYVTKFGCGAGHCGASSRQPWPGWPRGTPSAPDRPARRNPRARRCRTSHALSPASSRRCPCSSLANEASGIVASRRNPGVYYWLRDGGPDKPGRPRTALWGMRIDESGQPGAVHGDALFPSFPVTGASNVDWEALTIDDAGDLWIGQLGANDCRSRQRLHRVAEPDPATESTLPVLATYDLRFPDNPKSGCRTYNSEAMFWIDGHLYLFTKTDRLPGLRGRPPRGRRGRGDADPHRAARPALRQHLGEQCLGRPHPADGARPQADVGIPGRPRAARRRPGPGPAIRRAPKWQATFEGEGARRSRAARSPAARTGWPSSPKTGGST